MTGYHHLEWISPINTKLPSAEEIVWEGMIFKNRSSMKKSAIHWQSIEFLRSF